MNRMPWGMLQRSRITRLPLRCRHQQRRWTSTSGDTSKAGKTPPRSRLDRINAKLPRFLHRYTTPLLTAPVSHVTAFLILHELTAILPLLSLFSLFHYFHFTPAFVSDAAFDEGVQRFGGYLRRKGWIAAEDVAEADVDLVVADKGKGEERREAAGKEEEDVEKTEERMKGGGVDEWKGSKVLSEVACAYAVTKVLLPLRLLVSVWASPWFARVFVLPVSNLLGRGLGRGKGKL